MQNDTKLHQVALSRVPGIGDLLIKNLVSYCGSARNVFDTPAGKLNRIPGIGKKTLQALHSDLPLREAELLLKRAHDTNVQLFFYTDEAYPYLLKQIPDAPALLYYQGSAPLNSPHTVAIIGTRKCTEYGKSLVSQFIEELKGWQPLIVSGLAYGIDIAAHRTALQNGLSTVGVMASGIDIVYPQSHYQTSRLMLSQGGLLSENPFGTQPDAFHFPARNRIIAGLCQGTLVIEAAEKGGALITAELAADYDREVFATPGSLHSPQSAGCHQLIRRNLATLVTSAADIAEQLGWNKQEASPKEKEADFQQLYLSLQPQEQKVVHLLREFPAGLHIDELSWRTQIPINQMAAVLLNLEFQGILHALPGKKFNLQQ